MIETINTSRAKTVEVDIFNYDDIPLSGTYTSGGTPIDLTDYKFSFHLFRDDTLIETFTIEAGEMITTYLEKKGTDNNILDMEKLFEHLQGTITYKEAKLIQVVTDPDDKTYAYIIFRINAKRY